MAIEYLSIDLQFQEHHENDSKIHVQLLRPIENAKSVRLVSFRTANEFHNVEAGNNTFALLSYTMGNLSDNPATFVASIEPGYYQSSDLIAEINRSLGEVNNGQGGSPPGFDLISVTLFQLSNLRTQIKMQAGNATAQRAGIYAAPNKLTSHSIAARLGFSQDRVVTTQKPGLLPSAATALQDPFYKNEMFLPSVNSTV